MIQTGEIKLNQSGTHSSDLMCPRCGSDYLHHYGATFYDRSEDAKQEVIIDVDGAAVKSGVSSAEASGNPSSRRHGMVIRFNCEQCSLKGGKIELALAQHKVQTEISWRYDPI